MVRPPIKEDINDYLKSGVRDGRRDAKFQPTPPERIVAK